MKIALVTDFHFGVKKNNSKFLQSQLKFFNDVFFPYIKKHNINDIICLGDLFDNRNSINVNVLNEVDTLMVDEFNKYKTYMIVGNHDTYMRNTINIHSLAPFRHLKNINVIDEITQIELDGKLALLVPWQVDNNEFIKKISDKNFYNDFAFGHFEINGFNLNTSKVCDFGISPNVFFNNYGLTFSGHFHTRKEIKQMDKKIIYIGSPYEITRSDINQHKGFCVLDTNTISYEFINNDVSIKHKRFTYPDKFQQKDIEGNIVDVVVNIDDNYDEKQFQKYMLEIDSYLPYDVELKLLNNIDITSKGDYKIQNTEELIKEYIEDTDYEKKLKKQIKDKMVSLYMECKQND